MIIKMLVLVSFQLTLLNFYSPPDFEEPNIRAFFVGFWYVLICFVETLAASFFLCIIGKKKGGMADASEG